MELQKFEKKIQDIRARNGWRFEIECEGIWIITVFDKETGKRLGSTGSSGLRRILKVLEFPFTDSLWM